METNLGTFEGRVWLALHCLPREPSGARPSFKSIEEAHKLPLGTFSKILRSERHYPRPETLAKMADALGVSMEWLTLGNGEAPTPTGPVEERTYVPKRPGVPKLPTVRFISKVLPNPANLPTLSILPMDRETATALSESAVDFILDRRTEKAQERAAKFWAKTIAAAPYLSMETVVVALELRAGHHASWDDLTSWLASAVLAEIADQAHAKSEAT